MNYESSWVSLRLLIEKRQKHAEGRARELQHSGMGDTEECRRWTAIYEEVKKVGVFMVCLEGDLPPSDPIVDASLH